MTDEQHLVPANRDEPEVLLPNVDDPEVLQAFRYLALKQAGWTEQRIAEDDGITRQALWSRRQTWEKNGALEKAGQLILDPMLTDMEATNRFALSYRHQLIQRAIDIALGNHGASARTQLEAIAWVENEVYKPLTEKKEESGASELQYAKRSEPLKPTLIQRPEFLTKKISGE